VGKEGNGLRRCKKQEKERHRSGTNGMSELRVSAWNAGQVMNRVGFENSRNSCMYRSETRSNATRLSDFSKCKYTGLIREMGSLACGQNRTKGIIPNLARHAKP